MPHHDECVNESVTRRSHRYENWDRAQTLSISAFGGFFSERARSVFFALILAFLPTWAAATDIGPLTALQVSGRQYRLNSAGDPLAKIDLHALKRRYVDYAHARYGEALRQAQELRNAIAQLTANPSQKTLDMARTRWRLARPSYLSTEVFRFIDSPIDDAFGSNGLPGPEMRINAWPVNEVALDYVEGAPDAGLAQDSSFDLSLESIKTRDQQLDESEVITGWHAIEFMLWGQDRDAKGPGQRPWQDFSGPGVPERRRLLLTLLGELLVSDLSSVQQEWDASIAGSYGALFLTMDGYEALGHMLTGAAMLAATEWGNERLLVALDSGLQEDEHSCFSDNSSADIQSGYQALDGLLGRGGIDLLALLRSVQSKEAEKLARALKQVQTEVGRVHSPFDAILLSAPGDRKRTHLEATANSFARVAGALSRAGRDLGVLVSAPGMIQ